MSAVEINTVVFDARKCNSDPKSTWATAFKCLIKFNMLAFDDLE